jgi:ribonuclease-3
LIDQIDPKSIGKDPKSLLQEYLQSKKIDVPGYEVLAIEGEAHCQTFRVECKVAKFNITTQGEGTSRRAANKKPLSLPMNKITA